MAAPLVSRKRRGCPDTRDCAAAGKEADFIVLNANPLDDIANTRKIERVYLQGNRIWNSLAALGQILQF